MKDRVDKAESAIHGKTPAIRLKKGMDALIAYRIKGRVHYTQSARRMTIVRYHMIPPFTRVIYEDCSSAVTGLYWMAGLHDPNERHFNGDGFTGTLCENGHRRLGAPQIGDLVFYGHGKPWEHVACVYALNPTRVWSMGHEGGPVIEALDYRADRGEIRRYF